MDTRGSIIYHANSPFFDHYEYLKVKHFCPNVPIILVGNKKDLRSDEPTKRELMKMKQVLYIKDFILYFVYALVAFLGVTNGP